MTNRYNNRDYPTRERSDQEDYDYEYDPYYSHSSYNQDYDYDRNTGWRRNRTYRRNTNQDYSYRSGRNWNRNMNRGYRYGSRGNVYNRDYDYDYDYDYDRDYGYNRNRSYYTPTQYSRPRDYSNDLWDQGDWYDTDYYYEDYTPTWTYTEYWYIPGPYEGIGPNNYQRSDESIEEDINDRLTWHGRINAHDIQVDVDQGEVTLKGTVHSRNEKRMAEDVADSVIGVSDVHNRLKVSQPKQGRGLKMRSREIEGGQIFKGMEVVGKDGITVGTVDEIRRDSFKVDREKDKDVFVPFDKAHETSGVVMLDVRADQVDEQDWNSMR